MKDYPIVTICCSTQHRVELIRYYNDLTEKGYIVLADLTEHDRQGAFDKEMVDDMHKRKIDMSDEVHFLVAEKHIGDSVGDELAYAINNGKDCRIVHIK